MKECNKCGGVFPLDSFYGGTARCIPCAKYYQKKHRSRPDIKQKRLEARRRLLATPAGKEMVKASTAKYFSDPELGERRREHRNEYQRERRRTVIRANKLSQIASITMEEKNNE